MLDLRVMRNYSDGRVMVVRLCCFLDVEIYVLVGNVGRMDGSG